MGYNIPKFNLYVKKLIKQLLARGETSNDLLVNLFKGYLAATDRSFTAYIEKKLELYEEGSHVTSDQLMIWAKNKYDLLLDKGLWNAPTEEEEKIIALSAKIKQMEDRLKKGGRKTGNNTRTGRNQKSPASQNSGKRNRKKLPDWFTTQPKDVKKSITWNGKEWHWCGKATGGKCERFTRHEPDKCKGIKQTIPHAPKKIKAEEIKAEQADVQDTAPPETDDGFEEV